MTSITDAVPVQAHARRHPRLAGNADAELLDACNAFQVVNKTIKDWDADLIHLDEDQSSAAVRAWHAALVRVTGLRATTPAGVRAKLKAACLAISLHPDEIYEEEDAALSAMGDALALQKGGMERLI